MTLIPSITLLAGAMFAFALFMNLVRKNTSLVTFYLFQSLFAALALYSLGFARSEVGLLYAGMLTVIIKGIVAPVFLLNLVKKYGAHFSAGSYLNMPLSLLSLAATTFFAFSFVAPRLAVFNSQPSVPLLFAAIFATLFLMFNRRGALAAVVGILALENSIVLLSAFLGAQHTFALEFAIAFDIAVWIAIAVGFLTMMHRQFGEIDSATLTMTHLTEE
jgi:hydrogenase-4 membrane subunit HyfE